MLTLQQQGMLDADELFDDISGDLIDAFANAYVEKAQDKIVSNVLLSEGQVRTTIKRNLLQEKEKLRPCFDLIANFER